ncbi:nucleoside phosphorylase domain-containing protein [Fusarium napiforme]|uniref:Nucleoside phosphorylase domain-containing protein n=1 Tax=Fusarium napiforme TaxID=42672 RepID=A0A8H5IS97_9HYPO|nr:nucleoside phosphorylase domain-containing protein [Fusarium napiforme]
MSEPSIEDYTIGWICALQEEFEAACRMLDEEFEGPEASHINDNNTYVFGRIGERTREHNVVIGCLPDGRYGKGSAAVVSQDMVRSFPNLRFALMVGIGGGAPTPDRDIRLGDVVVSAPEGELGGVIQYDYGKRLSNGRFQQTGQLNSPPAVLLGVIPDMKRRHNDPRKPDRILGHLRLMDDMPEYKRPAEDRLYRADYQHKGGITCENCATNGLEVRLPRETKRAITVHYGTIASADSVMKDAEERDIYARDPKLNVLCFEMEAAGLMNHFPTLVIRGICDYSDSHKNDEWHKFAALSASAYAREILHVLKPNKVTALPSWAGEYKQILETLNTKVNKISNGVQDMRSRQLDRHHQVILDWLTPFNYGSQQSDYFRYSQQGTGQWFLESADYRNWLDTDGKTLFCPGIQGAGKTILSSIIINDLHTRLSDNPNIGIGYIYCNFRQEEEQKIDSLLAILLKQLSRNRHYLPAIVNSLYSKHKKNATRPLVEELSATLQHVTELYTKVFIIVDALDECQAVDDCRSKLLSEIFRLQGRSMVNLFATSRPIADITKAFRQTPWLEIRATKGDVILYVERHIGTLRPVIKTNPRLQQQIKTGISEAVDGMFLLAHIYLQFFNDKMTENDVRSALKEIQKQKQASGGNKHKLLSGAYDTIMERINRQKLGLRELAIQVLSWITYAKRQLTIIELQHALATKQGNKTLDSGDIVPVDDIVSVCTGLVTVDRGRDIIRLNHYTAQQYLHDKLKELFPNAEFSMMTTCLTYLSFDVFRSGFCRTDEDFEERMRLNPFYHYSSWYWGSHAYDIKTLSREAIDFLESTTRVESSVQALMTSNLQSALWNPGYSQMVPRQVSGLHLTAFFGLEDGVHVFGSSCWTLNARDSHGRTALSYAAEKGHERVVKLLLDKVGLDVDSNDKGDRTPLWWAAMRGHEAIVKLLLDTGKVDVDAQDRKGRSPLRCAVERGHEAIVELLHDVGNCDPNIQDEIGQTALCWAVERGQKAMVRLLLNMSDVDVESEDDFGRTPLCLAIEKEHITITEMLLDSGQADVNITAANSSQTIFSWASRYGHECIVKLLLRTGKVRVDTKDTHYGRTPLSWAAMGGHKAIVELLLSLREVNADAQDSTNRTPLWLAAEQGHEEIVHLLLNTGKVDLEARDNLFGQTPLDIAIEQKHQAVINRLCK